MMRILCLIDRVIAKVKREWRNRVFYEKTGQRANLIGDIVLINRNLKIGRNCCIYPYVQIFGDGLVEIGDNVDIGTGTIIYASKCGGGVKIGNNTMIAGQCYIIDSNHGTAKDCLIRNQKNSVAPITIGEDCWIAANVTILKGSTIHDGAVIGAKSLVNGEVRPYTINVGVPAKAIKDRS